MTVVLNSGGNVRFNRLLTQENYCLAKENSQ